MALIIRNLISENEKKMQTGLLFPDKVIDEIKGLYTLMVIQFEDATDYILTRNPNMRMHIKTGMETLFKRAEDCITELSAWMITYSFMPKVSYSYVAILDSIKGLSRELNKFSEKL
jgi:hypothetical protein